MSKKVTLSLDEALKKFDHDRLSGCTARVKSASYFMVTYSVKAGAIIQDGPGFTKKMWEACNESFMVGKITKYNCSEHVVRFEGFSYLDSWVDVTVDLTPEEELDERIEALNGRFLVYKMATRDHYGAPITYDYFPCVIAAFDRAVGLTIADANNKKHNYVCLHGPNSPLVSNGRLSYSGRYEEYLEPLVDMLETGVLDGYAYAQLSSANTHEGPATLCAFDN